MGKSVWEGSIGDRIHVRQSRPLPTYIATLHKSDTQRSFTSQLFNFLAPVVFKACSVQNIHVV